jgi:hypothetical protein
LTGKRPRRRGPKGVAPLPPAWLADRLLPIDVVDAGTVLHRVHRCDFALVFFGPGVGQPPTWRFDSATGRFGVMYAGRTLVGALTETLLRNPQRLMISATDIELRAATALTCRRPLRFVRLHGDGLPLVGTDNAISTGPYEPCGAWADALWDHRDSPDGIAYQSRHNSGEICLAVFERGDMIFEAEPAVPLREMLAQVAKVLDAYGKSISLGSDMA